MSILRSIARNSHLPLNGFPRHTIVPEWNLHSKLQASVSLPFITADASGPLHLDTTITRAKFEALIAELIERSIEPCKKALADAKLSVKDIDEVILVGGSTRIPLVQKRVEEFFGKTPNKSVNPDIFLPSGTA